MTLIVTVVGDGFVAQASDRRLTWPNGTIADDLANKAVCLVCQDAIISIGYCGRAEVSGVRTDVWLADFLVKSGAANKGFDQVIADVRRHAASAFRNQSTDRRVSFALGGFVRARPLFGIVSNFEDGDGALLRTINDNFTVSLVVRDHTPLKNAGLMITGTEAALSNWTNRIIRKLARRLLKVSENAIGPLLVDLIRRASRDPRYGRLIGKDCMTVFIGRTGNIASHYFPADGKAILYTPHLVLPGGAFSISVEVGQ